MSMTFSFPSAAAPAANIGTADARWTSLGYFNLYRIAMASVFLLAAAFYREASNLFSLNERLFVTTNSVYWVLALAFVLVHQRRWLPLNWLLTVEVTTDIVALTLLMHASGGLRGGIAIMMVVVLAGAGLVGQGRLTMLYAAMATLAVLAEQGFRMLAIGADAGDFLPVGTTSIGFFATAISARLLAQRVIANEELARQRGIDLNNQLRVNEHIIKDMGDGVLVVDPASTVRQYNPQAQALLGVPLDVGRALAEVSKPLADKLASFQLGGGEAVVALLPPERAYSLRARFVRPAESGDVLIYLEDLGRIQAQAQQLKLAALGRLTAGIAHEIRNPLAAISHAAELLREERREDMQERLTRIIGDNSRRLDRMVRDVLELGRRDRAQAEPIRLKSYLDTFLGEFCLREQVPRELFRVEVELDPVLSFDRAHLEQVLWNLLANALRYCSRSAGAIRVIARVGAAANRSELHVMDNGPGIDDAVGGHVFEPFFTTHTQGTGLGLYIAREMCDANRATLALLPNAPGAHFCITGSDHGKTEIDCASRQRAPAT